MKAKLLNIVSIIIFSLGFISCGGGGGGSDSDESSDTSSARIDSDTIRIMPLGDSITQAASGRASYRFWLWNSLESEGFDNVDFVGSGRLGHQGANSPTDFDLDHEGHWNFTTQDIANRSQEYAALSSPDIILMHIGTNDMFRGVSTDFALNNVSKILSDFRAVNPNVIILLAKPIPSDRSSNRIEFYGNVLEQARESLSTSSSPVIIVDQFNNFSVARDTYDGIHPDPSGEQLIASRWLAALRDFL